MKRYTVSIIISLVILSTIDIPYLYAQESQILPPGFYEKIALDLKNMDVLEVLKFLASKGKLNITAGNDVSGRITLFMSDITVKDAFDIIMFNNKLGYSIKDGVVYIMTNDAYKKLYGKEYNENKLMKIVTIKNSSTTDMSAILGQIKSEQGKIIINASTKTLVLIDIPEIISTMEKAISDIEESSATVQKIFKLRYVKTEEIEANIRDSLTSEIGKLRVDKRTNTVIITDLPDNMNNIKKLIAAFDTMPKQVLIETKIVEIRLTDSIKMGINWENVLASAKNLDFIGSFPVSSTLASSQKISIGKIPNTDLEATIQMLQSIGKTNVLSTPRITTISDKEAKILVGTREAYITQTVSQSSTTTTTSEAIEFIEVGVKLYVTPVVSDDGYVSLKIKPEVSTVTSTLQTSQGASVPIVSTTEAETNVVIKDGATVIIAGLIKDEQINDKRQMPILGNIPIIGSLFRSSDESTLKTELVVFLTPKIVTGEGDLANVEIKESKPLRVKDEVSEDTKPDKPKRE